MLLKLGPGISLHLTKVRPTHLGQAHHRRLSQLPSPHFSEPLVILVGDVEET